MKITIITPTIREGFWNIMAENLSRQTKKDFVWLIIDDHKNDRSHIARKYAQKYNLSIQYERGKKREKARKYGLVNANNTVVQVNDADLFVWLQDFMVIPVDAIAKIAKTADFYPMHLIALTDHYVDSKVQIDQSNTEDWFNGKIDVLGETSVLPFNDTPYNCWRRKGQTIRKTDDIYEFEMNFCAIPRGIISTLNGWWEFMDDGFGFDNTEFVFRSSKLFPLIVYEDVVATGINHTHIQDIQDRYYNFNDPRFDFLSNLTEEKILPIIRDIEIDNKIETPHTIPSYLNRDFAVHFMRTTTRFYAGYWLSINFPDLYKTLHAVDIA